MSFTTEGKSSSNACSKLSSLDLHSAFPGEVCPYSPCTFALFQPNDRAHASFSSAIEMQSQVLASAFCVGEMFEVYDSPIRQAQ